jgi:hypothetical protein
MENRALIPVRFWKEEYAWAFIEGASLSYLGAKPFRYEPKFTRTFWCVGIEGRDEAHLEKLLALLKQHRVGCAWVKEVLDGAGHPVFPAQETFRL